MGEIKLYTGRAGRGYRHVLHKNKIVQCLWEVCGPGSGMVMPTACGGVLGILGETNLLRRLHHHAWVAM